MEPVSLILLVVAAGFAGFIDSIVGGGGVITLPALLATGMPPHAAVATNKVVGTGASSIATWNYARAKLLHPRLAWLLWPVAAGTSALGAWTIQRLDGRFVLWAVLAVMAALTLYVLLRPRFGLEDRTRMDGRTFALLTLAVAAIGYYDGFLGPGTGNLLLFAIVSIAGFPLLRAAAHGRVWNFGSNVGALTYWSTTGLIDWRLGPLMAIGTVTGGWLGSRSNIRSGAKWVRPLFVIAAAALFVRLLL